MYHHLPKYLINIGINKTIPNRIRNKNIKISSRNPIIPNKLSGIKSKGINKYKIARPTTLKKCKLLKKSSQKATLRICLGALRNT